MSKWTEEQRLDTPNGTRFRQDKLCMQLIRPKTQATRYEDSKQLPDLWIGHSCIGDVTFEDLDQAREFAEALGYDGIYL